jgi:4-hydroxy-3-methylbut-2-enyl diphosphate reductase
MEVIVAKTLGFCFGVKDSVDLTEKAVKDQKPNVQILGPVVHNRQQVEALEKQGVHMVDSLSEATKGTLVIRAHGVHPKVLEEAKSREDLEVIDATCPLVEVEQNYAKKLQEEGYRVVIIGENDHPEAVGVRGHTDDHALIIETIEDAEKLPFSSKKLGIVVQTTLMPERVEKIVAKLFHKSVEVRVFNTICQPTKARQPSAREVSKQVDVMMVIGGKNSSNTKRLQETCAEQVPSYHIETEQDIKPEWLRGRKKVGVTAGASTPDFVIQQVVDYLKKLPEQAGTPADEPGAYTGPVTESGSWHPVKLGANPA